MLIKKVVGFKGDLFFDTSKPNDMPIKLFDILNYLCLIGNQKLILKGD